MKNKTICIIGAMDCEISKLKAELENIEEFKKGVFTFYKGNLKGYDAVIVKSGVGKVSAAVCTQIAIDKFNPDFIINTGIAGGLAKGMKIEDIIIAEKLVQHDFDASAAGYAKGYICNDTNSKEPTYFYTDKKLVSILKKSLAEKLPEVKCHEGVIASGDMFVASSEKKKELNKMFGAIAAEMEGAAIAHACTLNNIPFIVIRALSDLADETAGEGHRSKEEDAAALSAKAINALFEHI